jgi:hypothetical protein
MVLSPEEIGARERRGGAHQRASPFRVRNVRFGRLAIQRALVCPLTMRSSRVIVAERVVTSDRKPE